MMEQARGKRAAVIQHEAVETLGGNFTTVLEEAGFRLIPVPLYREAPTFERLDVPDLAEVDLIVALGGPMSANDDLPALRQEMDYLRAAATGNPPTPVLGICLGAQLLSRALGGEVQPTGGYQFGLRKIDVTAAGAADPVFREIAVPLVPTLHGERFTVPGAGTLLAEGTMLRRDGAYVRFPMAFRYGMAYGFQFEPQLTLERVARLEPGAGRRLRADGRPLRPGRGGGAQPARVHRLRPALRVPDGAHAAGVPAAYARVSGSAGADDPDGLAIPRQVCALLHAFDRPWWVAGGWAVDLFLGRRTRPHKDIEIALYRHDQSALQEHLAGWNLRKVVDHRRVPWLPGEALTLPVHEIHGRGPDGQALEILLNEHDRGRWMFRRDPGITRPAKLVGGRSTDGMPFLRPEIVLLYKSRDAAPDDHADFERATSLMDPESRAWLREALRRHVPGHRWQYDL